MAEEKRIWEQEKTGKKTKEKTRKAKEKVPKSKEKVPKSKEKISYGKFSFDSLITKMIASFLVLIVMILLLGTVSYLVAKQMISKEVKTSLSATVSAKGSYLEL